MYGVTAYIYMYTCRKCRNVIMYMYMYMKLLYVHVHVHIYNDGGDHIRWKTIPLQHGSHGYHLSVYQHTAQYSCTSTPKKEKQ